MLCGSLNCTALPPSCFRVCFVLRSSFVLLRFEVALCLVYAHVETFGSGFVRPSMQGHKFGINRLRWV